MRSTVTSSQTLEKQTRATTKVHEQCSRSVVRINVRPLDNPTWGGSGSIWNSDLGLIVTCDHVTRGAAGISVTFFDDTTYIAEVVVSDQNKDLAVLRVDAPKDKHLTPITVNDSAMLTVGQELFTIASPFGFLNSHATGIISALRRTVIYPFGGSATKFRG